MSGRRAKLMRWQGKHSSLANNTLGIKRGLYIQDGPSEREKRRKAARQASKEVRT